MSRHKNKTLLVIIENGCRDQEGMLKGLSRSLPGNLRLRLQYKLETPIKVATRYLCRYYINATGTRAYVRRATIMSRHHF